MQHSAGDTFVNQNLEREAVVDQSGATDAPVGPILSVVQQPNLEVSFTSPQGDSPRSPVLVVDDDPSILDIVGDILESEGYRVEKASNGAEALREVERICPAVILLDMRMPVMDGWTFAKALKERNIRIPILVMTAAQNAGRWADEIEADGYLDKPFDLLDLLHSIERYYSS